MEKKLTFMMDSVLHAEFKAACALNQLSMKEVMEDVIREFINRIITENKSFNKLNKKE